MKFYDPFTNELSCREWPRLIVGKWLLVRSIAVLYWALPWSKVVFVDSSCCGVFYKMFILLFPGETLADVSVIPADCFLL